MQYRIHAVFLFIGFVTALSFSGCGSQQSAVVATIGGENLTLEQFNALYEKSNGGKDASQRATVEDREKFLDLYTTFRLKVFEAYALGYQNDPGILAELQQYEQNLAVTYYVNKEITEPALRRMYERQSVDLRASHIILPMPPNASPQDTLQAYQKAVKIIDSLKNGRSFEELALNNSGDPNVKKTKGDLYFFTGAVMVPEFEEAAFSVQPGEIVPYPVRTRFGYHIIKVTAREPNPGTIRVSHIMKRLTASSTPQDSAKAESEMEGLLDSLKRGAKFDDLARKYSDDNYTKSRGGDLGLLTRGRTVKEFDQAAFKLKAGEVSGIVKSPYGLHLIQVAEVQPHPTYEGVEQELRKTYQTSHFETDYNACAAKLKKGYIFSESHEAAAAWRASLDSLKMRSDTTWDTLFTPQTRGKVLFSFAGQNFTIDSVIHFIKADPELEALPVSNPVYLDELLEKVSNKLVITFKAETVESTFPDFAGTIKEYEEGSMLFKAEQNAVWNKIVVNDSTMHLYFDAHRSEYTWPDRVNLQEIFVPKDSVAKVVTFLLKKQRLPFDSVAAQFNSRQSTKANNGVWGLMPVSTNALYEQGWKMNEGEVSEFFPYENGYSVIKVLSKDPARNKTFAEAGSELSSAYQEAESKQKESEWENSLRLKYPVKEFREVLENSKAQPSNK